MSLIITEDEKDTKLKSYSNYIGEYIVNEKFLTKSIKAHNKAIIRTNKSLNIGDKGSFYIGYRLEDVLISITDDLIRYATYHKVKEKDNLFSIHEPVRAAIFTKWILKLRPCIADKNLNQTQYKSSHDTYDQSILDRKTYNIEFCNENLALIASSIILRDGDSPNRRNVKILDLASEFKLFYSFRYRLNHQDTYMPLYNKIFKDICDG
jgi:hypothetical protein